MNYSILSLSELKALAIENNAIPTGDKRAKQSWIDALELAALQSTTAPELTDSEMEAAAVAVDINNGNTDMWAADTELPVTDYGDISTKKGATTVFASLLCILILAIQAVLCIGCSIIQIAIHIKNLFGRYNPDYDILGQLHDMVRNRKSLVPVG